MIVALLAVFSSFGVLAETTQHGDRDIRSVPLSVIEEPREFYGLATYYNGVRFYRVSEDGIEALDENLEAGPAEWLAVAGRLNVLVTPGPIKAERQAGVVELTSAQASPELTIVAKSELVEVDPVLDQVRYAHLWAWLAGLAKIIEFVVVSIGGVVGNWGIAICLFAVLMSVILSPVGWMTARLQRKVNDVKAVLDPQLAEIKANYDGEEAHNRIIAAHKDLGVSPFFTLKPTVGLLFQIPVLVAVFNALGEMPVLLGQSFLWIEDLAYPDGVFELGITLPFFGPAFNLLPFLMAALAIVVAYTYSNPRLSDQVLLRQRRSITMMAILFLLLFYPFPAAMVLYWTLSNLLQVIQRQIVGS